jgi:hypothetical protein
MALGKEDFSLGQLAARALAIYVAANRDYRRDLGEEDRGCR